MLGLRQLLEIHLFLLSFNFLYFSKQNLIISEKHNFLVPYFLKRLLPFKIISDIQILNIYTSSFIAISNIFYIKINKEIPHFFIQKWGLKSKVLDNTYIYCNLSNPEIGDLFGIEGRTSTKAGIMLDGNSEIATAN